MAPENTGQGSTQPTPAQRDWMALGYGMFLHFGPNTFAGTAWGDGRFPAAGFAPTHLDPAQWADMAAEAGMRYAVLTSKHHDGFWLWPTRLTGYSVQDSPGQPDVVGQKRGMMECWNNGRMGKQNTENSEREAFLSQSHRESTEKKSFALQNRKPLLPLWL